MQTILAVLSFVAGILLFLPSQTASIVEFTILGLPLGRAIGLALALLAALLLVV